MLKIQRLPNPEVGFALSGRIAIEDVAELQRLFRSEAAGQDIALDLGEVTLVDRDALKYLAICEAEKVTLQNCPGYIRQWIEAERNQSGRQKH